MPRQRQLPMDLQLYTPVDFNVTLQNAPVKNYLKDILFNYMKNDPQCVDKTCSICLENVLDCKRCFTPLACGHCFHASCWTQVRDNQCPECRQ